MNVNLELEDEIMKFRMIDPDDVRSDFDEYKGLGCPSIDQHTLDEVDLQFMEDD
jgi:hypothetical protein